MRKSVRKSIILGAAAMGFVTAMTMGLVRGAETATTPPATTAPAVVDVKNTKCIVAKDDVGDSKITVIYQGKLYHFCCADCKKEFNENPDKYVKDLAKDPASFGVK